MIPYKALYDHKCNIPYYGTGISKKMNIRTLNEKKWIRGLSDHTRSLKRIELVVYRFTLLSEPDRIHSVFHMSMLRWYRSNLSHVISMIDMEIQLDMTYSDERKEKYKGSFSESSLTMIRYRESYLGTGRNHEKVISEYHYW
ncbi:testis-specific serine/threonine-protein kinase 2-like [Gossypium australe]|uniref:Testis-specific serine/threonine-protein kinase 2-like n=1 Tax=Gossypium australe TaxID=47621 RepID=A0A5B6WSV8_9ROSI|nr:testis-specific serine/threonine-protein kinase 2-like [Gossypium australe]